MPVPAEVGPLLDWIRRYFDANSQDHQASPQEWWPGATPVVVTDRMPLVLQYQGHSRTIVGYEIAKDGATNLLAFDPSMRMKLLRGMALSCYYESSTKQNVQPDESRHRTAQHIVQSLKEPFRSHEKRHTATPSGILCRDGSAKRPHASSVIDTTVLEDSKPEEGGSKVDTQQPHDSRQRKKVDKGDKRTGESKKVLDSKKILRLFRINEKRLAKRDKYQVLWFPMGDPLTESDKQTRREVISDQFC
jgi:hypothetical protein